MTAANPVLMEFHRASVERKKRFGLVNEGGGFGTIREPTPRPEEGTEAADEGASESSAAPKRNWLWPATPPDPPDPYDCLAAIRKEVERLNDNVAQLAESFHVEPTVRPAYPSMALIQKCVAAAYGVTVVDIISARRTKAVIIPRQIAMYLCRHMTPHSMPRIGQKFGDRDHSTVVHAVTKVERIPEMRAQAQALRAQIDQALAAEASE